LRYQINFEAAAETQEKTGEAGDGSWPVEAADETQRARQKNYLRSPARRDL